MKGFRPPRERCHVARITSYNLHALLLIHTHRTCGLLYSRRLSAHGREQIAIIDIASVKRLRGVDVRYREISGRGVYRGVDLEANFFNFACTQSAGNQLVHPRSLLIAFAVCISCVRVCVCIGVCARLHSVSYLYL